MLAKKDTTTQFAQHTSNRIPCRCKQLTPNGRTQCTRWHKAAFLRINANVLTGMNRKRAFSVKAPRLLLKPGGINGSTESGIFWDS